MNTFKIGDVVVLKSGGPKMTIQSIEDQKVICVWFNGKEEIITREFPSELLIKFQPPRSRVSSI